MNKKILLSLVAMSGLFLTACSDESDSLVVPSDSSVAQVSLTGEEATALKVRLEGAAVSADEAKQRAGNLLGGGQATRSADFENAECEVYWVKYQSRLPQLFSADSKPDSIPLYLISYTNGGSVLISGDERVPDVLAYSEEGEISLEKNGSGLDVFIDNLPTFVSYKIDEFEAHYDSLLQVVEEKTGISTMAVPLRRLETEISDVQTLYDYAPMVKVKWGQGSPYNAKFPPVSDENGSLTHAYVGCTAVAVAQILSYHKYPTTIHNYMYHWSGMTSASTIDRLSNIAYITDIQNLMFDIANNCNPNYAYTGTYIDEHDANSYLNDIGYVTDGVQTYDKTKVVGSIRNSRPVCVIGYESKNVGHTWVIDGASAKQQTKRERVYEYIGTNAKPSDPIVDSEWKLISDVTEIIYKEEFVRCNFGLWEGLYDGVNYNHGVFNLPDGSHFNDNLQTITNIRPR